MTVRDRLSTGIVSADSSITSRSQLTIMQADRRKKELRLLNAANPVTTRDKRLCIRQSPLPASSVLNNRSSDVHRSSYSCHCRATNRDVCLRQVATAFEAVQVGVKEQGKLGN